MIDINDPEVMESFKYLMVTKEERMKLSSMPFDAKKVCWIPDHKEGFLFAEIQSTKGDDVTVKTSKGETTTVKKSACQEMNPPKYEKCEDMADLTYLNEACVLHNLRTRYMSWLIYTYSGLFCVTINPYKRLPVYTMKMVYFYRGKKKNEVPAHLYYVADNAYACMLRDRENQSCLITGESGAGKTENTKKVIQYFAFVASTGAPKKDDGKKEANLEDQIVSANPVLEAYGNAKTTRNNNSSRFGKFIRIHFGPTGKIAGADIESYLLEKSRVTFQQPAERNYHIFYQLLAKAYPRYHADMLVEPDPKQYFFIAQGMLTIDNVDDAEEMKATDEAFDVLMFKQEEKLDLFKCTAAIMHWGNSKWKQRPREEQAETDGTEECEKVSHLLGIQSADLIKGLLKPRIKVGNEYVNKGQNKDQVVNSIGALSKSIYSRCFQWLVDRVNETLDVKTKRQHFIGVLDIAGFEIFDYNGFEQLCINFTNERLQQFFNHFMFVLEQEEYQKEGIVWEMMNFGLDLQACIELIEKPMGILSILEEECIVPKATDKTFQEKLYAQHLGKHPNFGKPKPAKGKAEAHFDLHHYAGTVSYSVTGWLEKNKDPINTTVATLFKGSNTNKLLAQLYQDMGQEDDKSGKSKKSGSMQTISGTHKEQLNKLMNTLKSTHPHFVRCIIPNEVKTGGILDAHLVMHQLTCNGVLEGIRICRKGFPNRIQYPEFKQRYSILAPNAVPKGFVDATKATGAILKDIALGEELYRLGNTKVFFKAGVLGQLEELRDTAVSKIISMLQAQIRSYFMKINYKKMLEQKLAQSVLQRNIKAYLTLRNWAWWKLFTKIKPLLNTARQEEERLAREAEYNQLKENSVKLESLKKELEEQNYHLLNEKNKLFSELQSERENNGNVQERMQSVILQKAELETELKELKSKLAEEEHLAGDLAEFKSKLEKSLSDSKKETAEFKSKLSNTEAEVKSKENQISKLKDDMARLDEAISKLNRDKKHGEEDNAKFLQQLQQEEDKVNHLNKVKAKLEQTLDEAEENLEREKKARADLDKSKRKTESELKSALAQIEEVERMKKDVEDALKRKENELNTMSSKVEDEHSQATNFQRKIKELQSRLDEAGEELEAEKQSRNKAEKQRADLSRELDELNERLEEAGGATSAQLDLNKKREAELAKLRKDLEAANIQHESTTSQLKKKHQDAVNEMGEQIDQLQKAKNKLEKEKQIIRSQVDEAKLQAEHVSKAKANVDKLAKQLEQQLQELNYKLEDSSRQNNELSSIKSKLESENTNLTKNLEELESQVSSFSKAKQQFQSQIEEAKRNADEESKAKGSLAQQLRNLLQDLEQARENADEEHESKVEVQKQVAKLTSEAQLWRSKYETEGLARAEELEEAKRKLAAKLAEAEEQVEQALAKCISLEKTKQRLQAEVEDLMVDVERANANSSTMEKKQKQFDKLIGEWKKKCEDITVELEASQKEARLYSTEVFKLKSQYDESIESVEALRRENKNLADEVKDLFDQLGEGGKNAHELEKSRKRLEIEKEELQAALEGAEAALEQEAAKIVRAQLELGQTRQEIDRRLRDKEEEFENTRRNHQRAIESMQASLEAEAKNKTEAVKQKKKLEGDINELEIALDHSNRSNSELQKASKKLQQTISELQNQVEDEQRQRDDAREAAAASERRANFIAGELEEIRNALEQSEKARKAAEIELHDAADRISELTASNANLNGQKRKLESDMNALQVDLDEAISELKNSEERLKKSSADATRLAEELRQEQEHVMSVERVRKGLEQQVKDLQSRLDEAETNALKGGKRIIQKLEQRIHEVEAELESEQRHHQDTIKEVRKNDRRLKELSLQAEEDRRNQVHMQDLVGKLQSKLKVFKKQAEEAEELAAINLTKFRKIQSDLEEAESRANDSENQLNKMRAKNRSTTSMERTTSPQREQSRAGSVRRN